MIAWAKAHVPQALSDADDVRGRNLTGQLAIQLISTGRLFVLDTSDTITPDDGVTCLISNDGLRFKIVSIGVDGANGTDPGVRWLFASSTSMADPGAGNIGFNSATLASITALAISASSAETGNPSAANFIRTWNDSTSTAHRGILIVKKASAPQNFVILDVAGALTDNTSWLQATVAYVVGSGSFAASDVLSVQFYRTGDKGTGDLTAANNLSDVASKATARNNLFTLGTGLPYVGDVLTPAATGMADTDRQNILLERIYQSKSFGGYRRFINALADGYKATDGINAGSSRNYAANTTSGNVAPSSAATTVNSSYSADTTNGDSGFTVVDRSISISNSVTLTAIGIHSTTAQTFTGKIVKEKSTTNYDIVVSQSCVHTGTGLEFFTISGGYAVPASGIYRVATYHASGSNNTKGSSALRSYNASGNITGTGQTFTADAAQGIITAVTYGTGFNNMTLVTMAQTADATVSNGRVLLEIDNSASPTLNTDLTVEVTCNSGTNWAAATLSLVGAGQAGRKVVETVDQACTSGTSFAARIKTLNNKNVRYMECR
jgi:hypothetical protein